MPYFPENALVWGEIPVSDLTRAAAFYARTLGCELRTDSSGPFPIVDLVAKGVAAHLYQGTPAPRGAGPTLHLAVPDALETALERAVDAGAKPASPIITIPPGRFVKIEDPDGNSIGLFEPA